MIKNLVFSFLFTFFISLSTYSQNTYSKESGAIHSFTTTTSNNINLNLSKINGIPYENDNFQLGSAENKLVGKSRPFYIRYNIYSDVIELKEDLLNSKLTNLIKSLNIYAVINNVEYHYEIYSDNNERTREGYFILLTKGKNSSLYLKKIKKFKDKVPVKDSYSKEQPATFVDSKSYYYKRNDERVLLLLSSKKKQFLKQFPETENNLKKYMKSEKINLKNKNDFIEIFKYYDSLLE